MISGVAKIALRTCDQEAAKDFWVGAMGFELLQDLSHDGERWIEVAAPDGTRLILTQSDQPWPTAPEFVPDAPVFFECEDVVTTHAELSKRGVTFTMEPIKMFFGWWAMFTDPDGHRYALEQASDQKRTGS